MLFFLLTTVSLIYAAKSGISSQDSGIVQMTASNFMDTVSRSQYTIVKFYAPWCAKCQAIEQPFQQAAEEFIHSDRLQFGVVDVTKEESVLGGAGNVIRNLASLGAKVSVMSVVGNDDNAKLLKHLLDEIQTKSFLIEQKGRKTSKKTRIVAGNSQVFRFDHESKNNISFDNVKSLYSKLVEKIKAYDAILLADLKYPSNVVCCGREFASPPIGLDEMQIKFR